MNGMSLFYELHVYDSEGNNPEVTDTFERIGSAIQALLKHQGLAEIVVVGDNEGSGTATLEFITQDDLKLPQSVSFILED